MTATVRETALMVGVIYATDHDRVDLSGEWADELNPRDVVRNILKKAQVKHEDGSSYARAHAPGTCQVCDWWDAESDILDAFEEGFNFYTDIGGI